MYAGYEITEANIQICSSLVYEVCVAEMRRRDAISKNELQSSVP